MRKLLVLVLGVLLLYGCSSDKSLAPSSNDAVELTGDITQDVTLTADKDYLMTGQTFVKPGVTLTIEAGTTIKALPYNRIGAAPALIVEPGAKIIADGTAQNPITFTSALDEDQLPQRGLWGGLILLGKAPINQAGGQSFVEGIAGIPFGGDNADDNSGILRYVRVWYGGRSIGEGNEINGITFAGVGRGTTVEHCEVAWNKDDGFEFFGGTVDVKYLSAIFCGDDCFDSDWGYQGRGQYLFALLGQDECGRGFEMDNDGSNMDGQPRSFPQFCNVTLIGPNGGTPDGDGADEMIRLREGTGGDFRNLVVVNGNGVGVRVKNDPTLDLIVTTPPASGVTDALYFSPNNVVYNMSESALHEDLSGLMTVSESDPQLAQVSAVTLSNLSTSGFDPRPAAGSSLLSGADTPRDTQFFTSTTYRGAFDQTTLWLSGWSWLAAQGIIQ
jgi:hypothetical protein